MLKEIKTRKSAINIKTYNCQKLLAHKIKNAVLREKSPIPAPKSEQDSAQDATQITQNLSTKAAVIGVKSAKNLAECTLKLTFNTTKPSRERTIKTINRSIKICEKTPREVKKSAKKARKLAQKRSNVRNIKASKKIATAVQKSLVASTKMLVSALGIGGMAGFVAVLIVSASAFGALLFFTQSRENSTHLGSKTYIETYIFSWPLPGNFRITSPFGPRNDTFTGKPDFHDGIDIAAPENTPILAAANGKIETANSSDRQGQGYGCFVKINHNEIFETLYAHCAQIVVTPGQPVKKGQIIAFVGSTGRSTGNHLHFEIYENGRQVDPLKYFQTTTS